MNQQSLPQSPPGLGAGDMAVLLLVNTNSYLTLDNNVNMRHMQRYNRVLISMPRYKRFTQIMDLINFINFGIQDEPKKLRADPSRDQTYCFIPNSMVDP